MSDAFWGPEAFAAAMAFHDEQFRLAFTPGDLRRACGCPPEECLGHQDPVAAILAALSEPLGLPGASLPAYGVPGDGCCRECLRPPVHSRGLCVYCGALEPGEDGQARFDRIWCRSAVCLGLLVWACIIALWAAGVIR